MAGNYTRYPNAGSVSVSIPAIGVNGDPAPLQSMLVGGSDGADLIPLLVDGNGVLSVNVTALDPASGVATSANQVLELVSLDALASSVSADGAAAAAKALAVGGVTSGGVFQTFEVNASGHLNVADGGGSLTVDNAGTFAVQVSAALPEGANVIGQVTANAGTNLNTSALALESGGNLASINTELQALTVAIASTTSGQVGTLTMGAVTTAAPSYTTAQTNPLSLDTAGNLRVSASIAATQTLATVTTVGTVTNITNQGQIVDNAAFTDGTTRVMMNGYIFDEVAGTALTENDGAAGRIDSKRAQVNTIEDATTRGQRLAVSAVGGAFVHPAATPAATDATTRANSTALETSRVIKASAGRLYKLTVTSSRSSDQYFQIFNSTTVPADATAPIYVQVLTAGSTIEFNFSDLGGAYFSTGISVSNSTTLATKTIGSADCFITAEYA